MSGFDQEVLDTALIYGLIRDQKWSETVELLRSALADFPNSRAALSLMAYCHFQLEAFEDAAAAYQQLVRICPTICEYRINLAHCFYRAGLYAQALRVLAVAVDEEHQPAAVELQAACRYELEDLMGATDSVRELAALNGTDFPPALIMQGCLAYHQNRFDEAKELFTAASEVQTEPHPLTLYSIAACSYMSNNDTECLCLVGRALEASQSLYPDLFVTNGAIVPNSAALEESAIVEEFNLKAALEYREGSIAGARDALAQMPRRAEADLDAVTLHNLAVMRVADINPGLAVQQLSFLLRNPPFPPEAFHNLLLLYLENNLLSVAADLLLDNAHLVASCLDPATFDFIDATVLTESSPETAYGKFEAILTRMTSELSRLAGNVRRARLQNDDAAVRTALAEYGSMSQQFVPAAAWQCAILYSLKRYKAALDLLSSRTDACEPHVMFSTNCGHCCFQLHDYAEAARYYSDAIKSVLQLKDNTLLDVPASVCANYCVSMLLMSRNEEAEQLMEQLDVTEFDYVQQRVNSMLVDGMPPGTDNGDRFVLEAMDRLREMAKDMGEVQLDRDNYQDALAVLPPGERPYHLSIVNFAVGTLYCVSGNYPFGIRCVMQALQPPELKLNADTWSFAKPPIVALLCHLARRSSPRPIEDQLLDELSRFLTNVGRVGASVPLSTAATASSVQQDQGLDAWGGAELDITSTLQAVSQALATDAEPETEEAVRTVGDDARAIRAVLLQLYDD